MCLDSWTNYDQNLSLQCATVGHHSTSPSAFYVRSISWRRLLLLRLLFNNKDLIKFLKPCFDSELTKLVAHTHLIWHVQTQKLFLYNCFPKYFILLLPLTATNKLKIFINKIYTLNCKKQAENVSLAKHMKIILFVK